MNSGIIKSHRNMVTQKVKLKHCALCFKKFRTTLPTE